MVFKEYKEVIDDIENYKMLSYLRQFVACSVSCQAVNKLPAKFRWALDSVSIARDINVNCYRTKEGGVGCTITVKTLKHCFRLHAFVIEKFYEVEGGRLSERLGVAVLKVDGERVYVLKEREVNRMMYMRLSPVALRIMNRALDDLAKKVRGLQFYGMKRLR